MGVFGNVKQPEAIEDVVFSNLDVLEINESQPAYQGVLAIAAGSGTVVRNITFADIRVDHILEGKLLNLRGAARTNTVWAREAVSRLCCCVMSAIQATVYAGHPSLPDSMSRIGFGVSRLRGCESRAGESLGLTGCSTWVPTWRGSYSDEPLCPAYSARGVAVK